MGALGSHRIENRHIKKNSMLGVDDSVSPYFPDKLDECNNTAEDELLGGTVPFEDDDDFDTQLLDFENETQPMDLYDTQVLYLAGETQVIDDFELDEHMDTQLLDVPDDDTYCEIDEHGAERAQLVHDPKEFVGRNGDQTGIGKEMETDTSHLDNRGARTDILLSNDAVQTSGSSRKIFTAVRTASLRAASLAAQKKVSENARRSCSTKFSSRISNFQCLKDSGGTFHADAINLDHAPDKDVGKGLNKVARSLAKELFMEADCDDELEFNGSYSSEMTGLSKLPACETEVAGLSYVDSQEPGELSQANALEFVDRFLKFNVLEPDLDLNTKNATNEKVSPEIIAKGPQSLAQQANRRSSLGVASAYDWDDTHEDEGGGEFFTKKKEVLFGTSCGALKFCMKPQSSGHHGPKGSQSVGKLTNQKEQQSIHNRITGLVHSDSKLVKYRKNGQHEETNKKSDNYPSQQLGLHSCNTELLASATNAETMSMLDVGTDTQMAAEAMEALSFGSALGTNSGSIRDEDKKKVSRKKAAKSIILKQSSIEKRPRLSRSGGTKSEKTNRVTNKSAEETTSSVAFRTRSQHTVEKLNINLGNPKVKHRRLQMINISSMNERGSSHRLASVEGGEILCAIEDRLNINGSLQLERDNHQEKASVSTSAAQKTGQLPVNGVNDESDDFGRQRQCLDVVQSNIDKTKGATRSDVDSDNLNAREKTSHITTVKNNSEVDRSSSNGRRLQLASNQVNGTFDKKSSVREFGGLDLMPQSITRKTRSKRAQYAEFPRDACQLVSEKHQSCSPARGGEKSNVQVRNLCSPTNIIPLGLKTPVSVLSPLCVGDGYPTTPICKANRSLKREFYRLTASEPKHMSPSKDLRQRRDFSNVEVLFSQHLDEDVIKKQKKVLSHLGVPVASSISEATHFVADMFVRTRNMLEAIACGKPVVSHLWLESCGQSNCFIDEKNYILRDAKKEKELGFSMPNSLARASHCPLLEGRRVLVTPKVKPSKIIVSGLVKAVHGQATERLCRTLSNNDKLDDLLVLSCDGDFQECQPLLEKGIAVYSSELLLNGIITQRLDYERYRIFADHVKRTRSTLWVKKNGDQFVPVTITK